jgi:beta-N-acetylhexosaminidase
VKKANKMKLSALLSIMLLSGCQGQVQTGLDNLGEYRQLFSGKRIGIITNHTGNNSQGKHIIEVFRDFNDVTITALFGPEHGIYGAEAEGKEINSRIHPVYGVPVHSLYGKTLKPTPEMLKDIDIIVFDIQDIGARYYTYIYTMALAMEAAAENKKQFIVLDRPNPINGLKVEGNILKKEFAGFVGLYPIAVRHGMTVGELAKMFNEERWLANGRRAELSVIPMKGWRRHLWFDQTGLPFIKPSPNMPNLETAIVYPGLCLLEGTNISEGRGTDMPFRQFGAPWIDSEKLAARLNELNLTGVRFEATSFTPDQSKYREQKCYGVKIIISDRDLLEPFWTGVRIVSEIYRMYPDSFQWRSEHFDHLCGTSDIREAITKGTPLEKLKERWQPELQVFLQVRAKYLLYENGS